LSVERLEEPGGMTFLNAALLAGTGAGSRPDEFL
jgi:hypothetical protein